MSVIRQLKNWFTKQNIYPRTVEQAIYDSEGRRLDNKLANGVANPNILINADFRNPVNQRGKSSYNHEYCIDRWIASSTSTITVKDGCIGATTTNASTFICQKIEFPKSYIGRTLTLTFSTSNGLYSITKTIPNQFDDLDHQWFGEERDGVCASVHIDSLNALCFTLECRNTSGGNIDIYWAKLEEGEIATPFRPRLYAEELQLCQRYYWRSNGHVSVGYLSSSNDHTYTEVSLPVPMRVKPNVLGSNMSVQTNTGGSSWDTLSASINSPGTKLNNGGSSVGLLINHTSTTVNACRIVYASYIEFDAEL